MTLSANPIRAASLDWVPLRPGISMRPLHFEADGYALQLKVEPGAVVTRHRHTGEVHALGLSGAREIIDTGEVVGPGDYVFEPAGNEDSWRCHGDEPCVVHITLTGRVEYLGEDGEVVSFTDRNTALREYLDHCRSIGGAPDPAIVGLTNSPAKTHSAQLKTKGRT
jgi:2,4'-dihydroxyacetophenone dioxygenase